ncbi:hypothetical protein [Streptomyces sp. MP131-18]|uniref:nucleotide-binding protein n=1 Tax=Streptomyces sp. MP131-18 TaxID=1857892 RepID=UPI0009C9D86F|nr:hypothetical protein [Streptomyces sp. MP131-18]ONK12170.1 helicase/secretion neighborhood CpaE-like protein [Streptomyces sp. MP131-18]
MSAETPGGWQRDAFRDMGGATAPPEPAPQQPPQQPPQPPQPRPSPPRARPPHRQEQPAPVSAPVVRPDVGKVPARRGDPFTRRAGRALRQLLMSSASRDTAEATAAARAIQQPITTGRQIAVTSIRGGAGKTTVAALLALAFAHYRTDSVLAVEADPALGTLPHRLGADQVRWSAADLARIVDPSMNITEVTGYLLPFTGASGGPGGGWLLPGSQGAIGAELDIDTYRIVMTSLRRYFGTTVVDCETLPAEVARTALTTTQARVLVAPATPEGAAATRSVLDWMAGLHRSMLATTVVALTRSSPGMDLNDRKAAAYLEAGGAMVVPLPYDRSLAAGGEIRGALLAEATRAAAARLAAETMNRAMSRGRGGGAPV